MTNRKERLTEVYGYLREHHGIHTQIDFATALGYSRPVISSALNGNELALTDKLFQKVCEVYPEFNLEYLLTGEGSLLQDSPTDAPGVSPSNEMGNVLELYARMIRGVDDLRVQLKDALSDAIEVKGELQQARDDFRDATYRLNLLIEKMQNKSDDPSNIGIAADN
jgi:hypothetical protein